MFRIKITPLPDRSRQEAIKARIKERRKAALENVKPEPCHQQEKVNANS